MKQKIDYEDVLFSSFVNSNFHRFCMQKRIMQGTSIINLDEFYKSLNLPARHSILTADISELLFSIIWLNAEDKELSNIKPASLGVVDKYGCNDEQNFLRHLRNSIAHKRCEFYNDGSALFYDCFEDKKIEKENFRINLNAEQFTLLKEEFRNLSVKEFYPKTIESPFLTSVNIGENCYLGDYAFCGNINLETITLPIHIIDIPQWAFCNCSKLKFIAFPHGIKHIGKRAFSGCDRLNLISINHDSLDSIGDYALADCVSLEKIVIHAKTQLGRRVFSGWKDSQTIYVIGTKSPPAHWIKGWNERCQAKIEYQEK